MSVPFLIGGVNEGQFTENLLLLCPNISVRGFEIQSSVFSSVQRRMEGKANVKLYNVGWGEHSESGLTIGGSEGHAGLFNPTGRFASWGTQKDKASIVAMSQWCDQHNITRTAYVVIDVEGFEPKVLRGMLLEEIANQKRFPHFQFELGGTWAARDPRHGGPQEWSQYEAAAYVDRCGYLLFLIGADGWLHVSPQFFENGPHMLEEQGNGKFVQGNLLCLHSKYAENHIMNTVFQHLIRS